MGYNTGYEPFDGSYQRASLYPGFDEDIGDPWRGRDYLYSSENYGGSFRGRYYDRGLDSSYGRNGDNNYGLSSIRNYYGRDNRGYQLSPSMDYNRRNTRSYLGLRNRAYAGYPSYSNNNKGIVNRGNDRHNDRRNHSPSYSTYDNLNSVGGYKQYDGGIVQ
eukprot:CAMPEP_0195514868 /NCGR_PEP_ID=MMETSP0794_2-20130614/6129_1 /TAXON_ID=515487 /ORGANISM="Stephanopyxis turris, Strain CCMP 815" /LENGTH=160 /DNA_ID=CAMNT_0040643199 /DNA_START=46 /DNA_END=528 /DNA_ORIENTATION=-